MIAPKFPRLAGLSSAAFAECRQSRAFCAGARRQSLCVQSIVPSKQVAYDSIGRNPEAQRELSPSDGKSPSSAQPAGESTTGVGAALREAREQRAISLDDVAQATKIRVPILRAIETNRRELLPEAIYLRAFVRAYAREVGLDPGDTVRRYLDQFPPAVEPVQTASRSERVDILPGQVVPAQDAIGNDDWLAVGRQWLVVVIVLVVSLVGYGVARWRAPVRASSQTAQADQATESARSPSAGRTPVDQEIGTAGAVLAADDRVLHLNIQADGPCWLSATADGTRVVYGLMSAGEQHALDVRREAVLRIGDPAKLTFSINGVAGRSLGQAGEPVTARITRENYREFLRR